MEFQTSLLPADVLEDVQKRPAPAAKGTAFAQVLIDIETRALDKKTFTYAIPPEFQDIVQIGTPVLVSFGRIPEVMGFVVGLSAQNNDPFHIKDITEVLDDEPLFDGAYLDFLGYVADYCATPLSQVIQCALPGGLLERPKKKIRLTETFPNVIEMVQVSREAQRLLMYLKEKQQAYAPQYLSSQLKIPPKQLQKTLALLRKQGWIQIESQSGSVTGQKTEKVVLLTPETGRDSDTLTKRQLQILEFLKEKDGPTPQRMVVESLRTAPDTLHRLAALGWISITDRQAVRDPLLYYANQHKRDGFILSEAQKHAVEAVLADPPPESGEALPPFLLYGVTGSGKTEVYIRLTETILERGQSAMILVPEIALTSQIAKRFIERFGLDQIALWHSNLSVGEKADTWRRIRRGELKVVIGARSAVFTPLKDLGLIILDEEHDNSFKQDTPAPRYYAKLLAIELSKRTGAKILFGSATPDPVTFYHAQRTGRVLALPSRFGGRAMADVELVDMRKEKAQGNGRSVLSRPLKAALADRFEKQEQSIVLINRRGFYTLVLCSTCDYLFMCPHCSVALTVHRAKQQVRCHYCGYEDNIPLFCTQCASSELVLTGTGSQRVEEEITAILPEARVIRLDSDTLQRKDGYREVFESFAAGDADILVGTQMVAKGLDVANVTLVGVINADASFYLPDFKSSERGFQLLTQVAGRAGRGEKPGQALIQCLDPNHAVIQFAKAQDYLGFYEYEVATRQDVGFPPFCQLFRLIVSGPDEALTQHFLKAAVLNLQGVVQQAGMNGGLEVIGPAPCVIGRIQGRFRFHALIKNHLGLPAHQLVNRFFLSVTPPEDIHFLMDVDPQTLL